MPDKRNSNGTFAKGNKGGTGNPYARKVAAIRTKMMEAVSDEDIEAIILKLVEDAKNGDPVARKELLDRLIGKPIDSPHPDELDSHETKIKAGKESAEQNLNNLINNREFLESFNILQDFHS